MKVGQQYVEVVEFHRNLSACCKGLKPGPFSSSSALATRLVPKVHGCPRQLISLSYLEYTHTYADRLGMGLCRQTGYGTMQTDWVWDCEWVGAPVCCPGHSLNPKPLNCPWILNLKWSTHREVCIGCRTETVLALCTCYEWQSNQGHKQACLCKVCMVINCTTYMWHQCNIWGSPVQKSKLFSPHFLFASTITASHKLC